MTGHDPNFDADHESGDSGGFDTGAAERSAGSASAADDASDEVYDLVGGNLEAPDLPGSASLSLTPDEMLDAIAADMVIHAENCVREFGDFHLALSLGRWSQKLYERLMYDPNYRRLPWRRTHLWIVNDRCVSFEDEISHFRQIRETIVDHSDIPPAQVHPIFPMSDGPADQYEAALREALAWREKGQDRLDFVLLEMDAAGCAGSMFERPGAASWTSDGQERLVRVVADPVPERPDHICMTPHLIQASRFVAIIACGSDRRDAVERIARGLAHDLPVTGLYPHEGEMRWYLDADACPPQEDSAAD